MQRGSIERTGCDDARSELETKHGKCRIVDEGPCCITQILILIPPKETYKVVEDAVWLLQLQVKAERFEKQVLIVQDGISPFPELLGLFVHNQIRVLLRHPTACHHDLSHLPTILLHLGSEEERCRCDRIRVHSRPVWQIDHAVSHEESVQVYTGRRERQLRQLQHDPHLCYEVDALAAARVLCLYRHPI